MWALRFTKPVAVNAWIYSGGGRGFALVFCRVWSRWAERPDVPSASLLTFQRWWTRSLCPRCEKYQVKHFFGYVMFSFSFAQLPPHSLVPGSECPPLMLCPSGILNIFLSLICRSLSPLCNPAHFSLYAPTLLLSTHTGLCGFGFGPECNSVVSRYLGWMKQELSFPSPHSSTYLTCHHIYTHTRTQTDRHTSAKPWLTPSHGNLWGRVWSIRSAEAEALPRLPPKWGSRSRLELLRGLGVTGRQLQCSNAIFKSSLRLMLQRDPLL